MEFRDIQIVHPYANFGIGLVIVGILGILSIIANLYRKTSGRKFE